MRKAVMLVLVLLTLVCSAAAFADEFDDALEGRAVNVTETETDIDIYMRYSIIGSVADRRVPNEAVTYAEAFAEGVCEAWDGVFEGKSVNVHLRCTEEATPFPKVRVYFFDPSAVSDYSRASKAENEIRLCTGDGRTELFGLRYTYRTFKNVAAHEAGHIFGLADAYRDENENIRTRISSIMRDNRTHAAWVDYYIMLKYKTWLGDCCVSYGSDETVLGMYREMCRCKDLDE